MEVYKPIPEFPAFLISKEKGGEITKDGHIYKQRPNNAGNSAVELCNKNRLVKVLMYQAHIGEIQKGFEVQVKSGVDRMNFSLSDLEAVSVKEIMERIERKKLQMIAEGWRFHPDFSLYGAESTGKTWSMFRGGKEKTGSVKDGYVFFKLKSSVKSTSKKAYSKDRFVWEAWNNKLLDPAIDIHHINNDTLDNSIENLKPLTRPEHNRITFSESSTRSNALRQAASKPVVCYMVEEPEKVVTYESYEAAGLATGIDRRAIGKHIGGEVGGYVFENVTVESIEGETWKAIRNIEISNKGRIKRSGIVSFGCKRRDGEFVAHFQDPTVNTKKIERIPIKRLVCEAFHGPQPSATKKYVRRIDKSSLENNCADNLAWASKLDCVENAKNVKKVVLCFKDNHEVYSSDGIENVFESISAIIRHFEEVKNVKFDHHSVRNACSRGKGCTKLIDGRAVDFFYFTDVIIQTNADGIPCIVSNIRIDDVDKRRRVV